MKKNIQVRLKFWSYRFKYRDFSVFVAYTSRRRKERLLKRIADHAISEQKRVLDKL